MRKMLTCISGEAVRISTRANTTRMAAPTAMHAAVAGLPHPQTADSWKPNTLRATPDAISARPR